MIIDSKNRFISSILENCDIRGKHVLEVGCGKGRITGDLCRYAAIVDAIDTDRKSLIAAKRLGIANVRFHAMDAAGLRFPGNTFDAVVYSLSLHHIPVSAMERSLILSAKALRENGVIIVIEPYYSGSVYDVEERFNIADGNERREKRAAHRAITHMKGWTAGKDILFETDFIFDDFDDFLRNFARDRKSLGLGCADNLRNYLMRFETREGIVLNAWRRLNIIRKN